jgi:hypothetical protein
MSGLGVGHARKGLLESDLGTGHVRCLGLTQVNSRRPDISGPGTGYVQKRLSRCEEGDDWIWPLQESDMLDNTYWNLAMDPNKFGGLRNSERFIHVRARGRTCSAKVSGTRSGDRICLVFLASWIGRSFFDDLHFTNSPSVPP